MYSVREQIEFGCWENAPIEEIQAITRILSTCSSQAVEFSWVKKTPAGCGPANNKLSPAVEEESKYDECVASEAAAVNVPCVEKNHARAGQAGEHALSSIREASLDICGSSAIHRLDTTPAVSSIVYPSYCAVTPLVGGVTGHSLERTGAITNLASAHAASHSMPAAYYGYANSGLMPVMRHMQLVATPPVYYPLPRNFNYNINMSACGIVSQPVQAAPYAYHSTVLPTGLPSSPLGSVLPENMLAPASHPSLLNASQPAGMTNVMLPTVYPTAASCSIPVQMDIGSPAASSALYPVDLAIMPVTVEQATPVLHGHKRTTEHDDISFQQRNADSAVVEIDKLQTSGVNAVANENAVGLSEHPWSANLSKNNGNIPVSVCFGDGIDELLRNKVSVSSGVCSSESKTVARSVSERNKQELSSCTLPDVKAQNEDVPHVSASCEIHFNDNASCPPHTTDTGSSVTNISKMTETSISATSSRHITASELSPTTANDSASSQKSWASLFKGRSSNNQVSHAAAANSAVDNGVQQTAVVNGNGIGSAQLILGEMLHAWRPAHKPVSLVPRGLVNRTNWCYVNAILQSLLACPPFYNLMKDVAHLCDTTHAVLHPITESLVDFVGEFSPVTARAHDRRSSRHAVDLSVGSNLEASSIFRMLETSNYAAMFKQGRQEDAEEFLSCILNGLHDEMVADIQAYFQHSSSTDRLQPSGTVESGVNGTADDWEQVGPRNKATLTRTVDSSISPVSTIFQGQIRSIVSQAGGRDSSTLQPFFTLQLDIQPEGIRSINDALAKFVSRETLEGFTCSKTKQEVSANRRVLLELLPPVIILHLKCFVYNKDGCQKLFKDIDFDVDLELSKDLFSPMSRSKYAAPASRKYKLFAVLNHYGQRAVGGHYSTDYYHAAINGWVRADDGLIRHVSQDEVTRRPSQCMPYLLFYRRLESQ